MQKKQRGFTLIEVMIVVVILATLGALIVPNLIGQDDKARVAAAKSDLGALANALELYRLDTGRYPTTAQGLKALIERPVSVDISRFNPDGYLKRRRLAKDPWDNLYQYKLSGSRYELFSLGRDGRPGGEGYDADLHYSDI